MSDLFDLDEDGGQAQQQRARENLADPLALPLGAWDNVGEQVGKNFMLGSATAGRSILQAAPAALELFGTGLTDEGRDWYSEHVVEGLGQRAVDYWTPDAASSGSAAQVLGGVSNIVGRIPQIFGTPGAFLLDMALTPATDVLRAGGDLPTAAGVGGTSLVANAVGMRLPASWGAALTSRLATGAASNVGLGVAQNALSAQMLEAGGLDQLAASYDPMNPQALFLDATLGAVFGAKAQIDAPPMTRTQRAALLATNNAHHYANATLPGEPTSPQGGLLHQENLGNAIDALLNDRPVDAAVPADLFTVRPELAGGPTFATAIDPLLQAEGGFANDPADRGGMTKYGISQRAYPNLDIANLTEAQARDIYRRDYWNKIGADALPAPLREVAFDAAVNHGVGWARAALAKAGDDPGAFLAMREAHYRGIVAKDPSQAKFLRGWLNRLGRFKETNPAGQALRERLVSDPEQLSRDYAGIEDSAGGTILNTDIARELSPEYLADRTRSADVHEAASDTIKTLYEAKLAEPTPEGFEPVVMFTAGGTGAGKTTAIQDAGGFGKPEIVYDTNMNTLASAVEKVEQALEAGREVRIAYVYRDPVESLVAGAIPRARRQAAKFGTGRTVPLKEHAKTHAGVRSVMEALADKYRGDPRVDLVAIDNSRGKGQAQPARLEDLPKVEQTTLHERLQEALEQARAAGLDEGTYRGFRAEGRDAPAALAAVDAGARRQSEPERPGREVSQRQASEQALDPDTFPAQGDTATVVTERGMRLQVQYAVVDAADLVTSHDDALAINPEFPAELQPRDRTRAASEQQITRIANGINPELLAESPKAADGAPIVGRDRVVESGNARTIALRRAYGTGKADGYRAYLLENAERYGLDPVALDGIAKPVLVRVALGDYNRAEFASQANESTVASMSASEQALADARVLPDMSNLVANDDGTINMRASGSFVNAFIRDAVGPNEQASMATADGSLSQQGQARIRSAVFARAYGDPDLVALMAESTDANVKNLLAGMLRAAPSIAKLREMIDEGGRFGPDIAPDLVMAVRKFSQLRSEGMTVEAFEAQGDFFGDGGLTPAARDLLRVVGENARAPKRMFEVLQRYVDNVHALGDPRQADLMGGAGQAGDTMQRAAADTAKANEAPAMRQGGGLFNAAGRPAVTPENRAAYEAIAANPELQVLDDNGILRPASEFLGEADADAAQADETVRAIEAAANCFERGPE